MVWVLHYYRQNVATSLAKVCLVIFNGRSLFNTKSCVFVVCVCVYSIQSVQCVYSIQSVQCTVYKVYSMCTLCRVYSIQRLDHIYSSTVSHIIGQSKVLVPQQWEKRCSLLRYSSQLAGTGRYAVEYKQLALMH